MCASKITERRRCELTQGLAAARSQGLAVLLVTYTLRHKASDSLRDSLTGLLRAREGLLAGKWAKKFTERWGIVGRVRALEVTHGRNGWHPHVHELVILRKGFDQAQFTEELRGAWSRKLEAAGMRDVTERGLDVRFADMKVADYVSKFGRERTWGPEHELTKAAVKGAKNGNLGPVGLLTAYLEGEERAGALWREYALEFKGKRQLVWSDGLRNRLGLNAEKSDQELAEEVREDAQLMDDLTREEWAYVLGNDARAELLIVLGTGNPRQLRRFLRSIGIERPGLEGECERSSYSLAEMCGQTVWFENLVDMNGEPISLEPLHLQPALP